MKKVLYPRGQVQRLKLEYPNLILLQTGDIMKCARFRKLKLRYPSLIFDISEISDNDMVRIQ